MTQLVISDSEKNSGSDSGDFENSIESSGIDSDNTDSES